ncbi:MAG TPA: hypothetical protein VEA99_13000 [Gemmatimonadaceae bacterium]|nr:hypothetical protein [Gemmatimonadaceae bacterium]
MAAGFLAALASPVAAQSASGASWHEAAAGGMLDRYRRALELAGLAPASLRGAHDPSGPSLAGDSLRAHPWAARMAVAPTARLALLRPEVRTVYNSAFPYLDGADGPVWTGKGATLAAHGGVVARWGRVTAVLDPIAFVAQNASFALTPQATPGLPPLTDPVIPWGIDRPQRFGDGAYARLEPGNSTLRVDLPYVAVGLSSANEVWGPAVDFPLILSANAPGIPRLFVGTSGPVNVGIGRVAGRLFVGRLAQSSYFDAGADSTARLASGIVATFSPRGVPGLEIGGARFFHRHWEGIPGPADLLIPFEGLLKEGLRNKDDPTLSPADNQLGSIFVRWAVRGLEAYGEYARDDHSYDARDLAVEPDHYAFYVVGLQRVWSRTDGRALTLLRGEVLNGRLTSLAQVRGEGPIYPHGQVRQGHTHRGQILGADAAFGGGGSAVTLERYHERGRWSVEWRRALRMQRLLYPAATSASREGADVLHSLGGSVTLFRGAYEVDAGLAGVANLNRDFDRDAFGLQLTLGARAALPGSRR